ncbi:hypothetical protein MUP50_00630 [Patescibacteria group bacterium]|nr:hypothetical protein [Patescibacteria group bacterium]
MKVAFSLKHVSRITDNIGIIEHCIFAKPNRKEGYCVDDNARALLACLRVDGKGKKTAQQLIPTYLRFLVRALDKKGFHQDLNSDLTWKDDAGVEDGFGRAMVALGETTLSAPQDNQKLTAAFIFDQQAFLIPTIKYPRVMAQTIIAISKRIKFKKELVVLSDKLTKNYQKHSSESWRWYEDIIAYDNGRLPLSLFCAFQVTKDQKYLEVAKESLDFLAKQTYDHSKDCFSFVGNKGWYPKNKKPATFDQQPIEAGSMVEACAKAYEVLKDPKYLHFARTAFLWYSGKNILGLPMIDNLTGGIYDGLESQKVNQNEGAESVLSYILACLALKEIE